MSETLVTAFHEAGHAVARLGAVGRVATSSRPRRVSAISLAITAACGPEAEARYLGVDPFEIYLGAGCDDMDLLSSLPVPPDVFIPLAHGLVSREWPRIKRLALALSESPRRLTHAECCALVAELG